MVKTKEDLQREREFTPSTNRTEAFSDGVFAIVVTLLVLELRIPDLVHDFSNSEALNALYNMLPKFTGFVVSFVVIAIYWVNHHQLFQSLECADRPLLWYNNLLLFWMCFIPFPTAFIGEYPLKLVPVMLYGAVLTLAGISFDLLLWHCIRADLFRKNLSRTLIRRSAKRGFIGPVIYFISIIAAPVSVYISLGIFIFTPLLFFIPQKIVEGKDYE